MEDDHDLIQTIYEVPEQLNIITGQDLIELGEEEPRMYDIRKLQEQCPHANEMIQYLEVGFTPESNTEARRLVAESEFYIIENDILYHYRQPRMKSVNKNSKFIRQLVVPTAMQKEVMEAYHDKAAHPGFDRCYLSIAMKYYWKGMHADLQQHIRSCDSCQRSKYTTHPNRPPMQPLPVVNFGDRWHMDILCLPKSKEGYRYILLCVDSLSRYPEAILLKNQKATTIAEKLYSEIITRYGPMKKLLSDRGKNFMSNVVAELSRLFGIKRIHTSDYHPKTNGAVERINASIWTALRVHCKNQEDWPEYIPSIMYSFRAIASPATTTYSPYYLTFRRHMKFPIDLKMPLAETSHPKSVDEYMQNLISRLKIARDIAMENSEARKEESKARCDKTANNPDFTIGDRVLLFIPQPPKGKKAKLHRRFEGPYYITARVSESTYRLRDCTTHRELSHPINVERIKRYHDGRDDISNNEATRNLDNSSSAADVMLDETQSRPLAAEVERTEPPVGTGTPRRTNETVSTGRPPGETTTQQDQWYKVEKVLKTKVINKKRHFLVKWKDYDEKSWVPEHDVSDFLKETYYITHTKVGEVRKKQPIGSA